MQSQQTLYATPQSIRFQWLVFWMILGGTLSLAHAEKKRFQDFRGSSFIYRNALSINSFDKNAEPTYNPYYAKQFILSPQYWISPTLFIRSNLSLDYELTEADERTHQNETLLGDWRNTLITRLHSWSFGLTTFATAGVRLPTSLFSQARTMNAAFTSSIALIQALQGWGSLSYSFGVGYTSFRYTTGELETPRISQCMGAECDPFINTGVRNAPWQISHSLSLNIFPKSWLFLSAGLTWIESHLFPRAANDELISYVPQDPTNKRHFMSYNVEVDLQPTSWLIVAFMLNTFNPQLAPDSTHYAPFLNRFSNFMVDLRFTWGIFRVAQAGDDKKKKKKKKIQSNKAKQAAVKTQKPVASKQQVSLPPASNTPAQNKQKSTKITPEQTTQKKADKNTASTPTTQKQATKKQAVQAKEASPSPSSTTSLKPSESNP